ASLAARTRLRFRRQYCPQHGQATKRKRAQAQRTRFAAEAAGSMKSYFVRSFAREIMLTPIVLRHTVRMLLALPLLFFFAADKPMFNGKNLDGWEVIGDGQWTVMADGTLLAQRTADVRKMLAPGAKFTAKAEYEAWENTQSWLYTKRSDFGEF